MFANLDCLYRESHCDNSSPSGCGGLVPKTTDYQTYEQQQGEDIHKDRKSHPETSIWLNKVTLPRNNIFIAMLLANLSLVTVVQLHCDLPTAA